MTIIYPFHGRDNQFENANQILNGNVMRQDKAKVSVCFESIHLSISPVQL